MASALPCVLSPHAFAPLGMPAHGHAEICDQPDAFAAGIDRLLAHPEQAQDMARMAQQEVKRKFAWTTHGETLNRVLQDAVAPHCPNFDLRDMKNLLPASPISTSSPASHRST